MRSRGRIVAGLAIVAVLVAGCSEDEASRERCAEAGASCDTSPPSTTLPPSGAEGDSTLMVTVEPATVDAGRPSVEVSMVARATTEDVIGLAAGLESWDGQRWVEARSILLCVGGCAITERDPNAAVPSLGITATPGQPTSIGVLAVGDLPPGWYRVSAAGAAPGVFSLTAS